MSYSPKPAKSNDYYLRGTINKGSLESLAQIELKVFDILKKYYPSTAPMAEMPLPLSEIVIKKPSYLNAKKDLEKFLLIVKKVFTLVITEHLENFNLTPIEKELISSQKKSLQFCPFIRIDCAFTENGLKIIEINARHPFGPGSRMVIAEIVNLIIPDANKFMSFDLEGIIAKKLKSMASGLITLVYIPGKISVGEVDEIKNLSNFLNSKGLKTIVSSSQEINFTNSACYLKNQKISLIYRWFELQKAPEALLKNLKNIVVAGNLKLINDFSSIILGNKNFLALISEGYVDNTLNSEEIALCRRLIPKTTALKELKKTYLNKDRFVLKNGRGTEGKEVIIGKDVSQKKWQKSIKNYLNKGWVLQEFIKLPKVKIDFAYGEKIDSLDVIFDFDPYFVDGKFSGFISRASTNYITNYNAGGMIMDLLIEK